MRDNCPSGEFIPRDIKLPSQVFSGKLLFKWEPRKIPYKSLHFMACLPSPYKLSILDDIWKTTILPLSSSKYFYSWQRLSGAWDELH